MRLSFSLVAVAVALASGSALAQQSGTPSRSGTGLQMPYERGFWGNVGFGLGRSKLDAPCPAGASCDLRDNAWRAHVGGRFNNIVGGEIGLVDLGDFRRGGGETSASGLDLKLVAGFPIGQNSSVFGKLGAAYLRTRVSGTGLATGTERDWGATYGLGAQIGLTPNWAVRADLDRYRIDLPGAGKDDIDTVMIGAQYSFQ